MSNHRLALIAHDSKKPELVEWAKQHRDELKRFSLCATGTTGARLEAETKLTIEKLHSGPRGGDLQIGAQIAEGKVQGVIFLWDPLSPQPHDVDVKALLRVAVLYNVPLACNLATADAIVNGFLRTAK